MDLAYQALQAQVEINDIESRIRTAVMLVMKTLEPVDHLLVDRFGNEQVSDLRGTLQEHLEEAFYEALHERKEITKAADAAMDEAHQNSVRKDYLIAQMGSVVA